MYPQSTVDLAKLLSNIGVLDRENAEICGVSIRSIRHWRHGDRRRLEDRQGIGAPNCPRCHGRALDERAYSYLLGLYLGDGHIVHTGKTYLLAIACTDTWPGLLAEARQAVKKAMPSSSVFLRSRPGIGCTYVQSVSKHWPCLFRSMGRAGNTSAGSSLKRGSKRSSVNTRARSSGGCFIPTAAAH